MMNVSLVNLGGEKMTSQKKVPKLTRLSLQRIGSLFSRKLRNLLAVRIFKLQKSFAKSLMPAPVQVVIEPTNRCNLNCQMCARRYWDAELNPLGDMSFGFFAEYVLPHLKPFQTINLQCFGEPLINQDFLLMLEACKSIGCYTTFTTNGIALKQHAEAIVSIGPDEVTLSIDGVRSMSEIRNVGIDRMIDAINSINIEKRRNQRSRPLIGVNCVLTSDVLPELPDLIEIAGCNGVSKVTVIHMYMHDLSLAQKSVIPIYDDVKGVFEKSKIIAKRYGIHLLLPPQPGEKFKCRQPFNTVVINWNGDVRPCCESVINEKDALFVGNLKNKTLPELWNSDYMHRLRRALIDEKELPKMCVNCPYRSCSLESHMRLLK